MIGEMGARFVRPLRRLRREPLSASLVVAILGLTLGAAALVFTLADVLLLAPLPFHEPDRLVQIGADFAGSEGELSMRELRDVSERTSLFTDIAAYKPPRGGYTVSAGTPFQAPAILVTHNLFSVLGVAPALGSSFPASYDLERSFGIVMSDRLFRSQLGGDPRRLDDVLTLDGAPNYQVFGVLPPGFDFPVRTDLYRSIYVNERNPNLEDRSVRVALGVGRLADGVSIGAAQARLAELSRQLAQEFPDTNREVVLRATALQDVYAGDLASYLGLLAVAVGALLVIGCVVTANLLLARSLSRATELAVRAALGASRRQLAFQVLVDGAILCGVGAAVGLAAARGALELLPSLVRLDLPSWQRLEPGPATWIFGVILALGTALVTAVPAVRLAREAGKEGLRRGGRASHGLGQRDLGRNMVTLQAVLAFVLLAATSTLILGFRDLSRHELGFQPAGVASFKVNLPWFTYSRSEPERIDAFHRDVLAGLEALPSVEVAASTSDLPFTEGAGAWLEPYLAEGRPAGDPEALVRLRRATVSTSLFDLLGMDVREGRGFGPDDRASTRPVAVVSQSAAELLWPGESAVGKRLRSTEEEPDTPWLDVVGVVGDVRRALVSSAWEQTPAIYLPAAQVHPANVHFVLRVREGADPESLRRDAERVVQGVDALQPIWDVETLDERLDGQLWRETTVTWLVSIFALAALLIAAGGLYALLAETVRRRRREIGIRKAVGADQGAVVLLVLADAGRILGPALLVGGLAAFVALEGLARRLAFLDRPSLAVIVGTACALFVITVLAALSPARWAAGVDPATALRES